MLFDFDLNVHSADLDGGVHSILPIDERVHARLAALEKALTQNLDHYAGLNPRAFRYKLTRGLFANTFAMELISWKFVMELNCLFRMVKHGDSKQVAPRRLVVDADLLKRYITRSEYPF